MDQSLLDKVRPKFREIQSIKLIDQIYLEHINLPTIIFEYRI